MSNFNSTDDIVAQFPVVTVEDSIRNKDWAAGSSAPVDVNDYYWKDGKLQYTSLMFPPSLYKCIDEVVVNALDHMWKMIYNEMVPKLGTLAPKYTPDPAEQVSHIDISVDHTGVIMIKNNGRGVPVVEHPVAKRWLPHHIFGTAFQGSNYVKDEDNIVGGTNGIGAKIANIKSSEFTLETVDAIRKLKYRQTWRNGMRVAEDPVIVGCSDAPYTLIAFRPLYTDPEGYKYKSYDDIKPVIESLIITRAINAALYASLTTQCARSFVKEKFPRSRKMMDHVVGCKVTSGGESLPINTLEEFVLAATGGDCDIIHEMLVMRNDKTGAVFEWDVRIVVGSNLTADYSIVDGIIAPKGTHISYLYDQIVDAVRAVVDSKGIKPAQIRNAFKIFCVCKIANPKWEGQRKEEINNSKKQYRQTFSKSTIETAKTGIIKYLEELLFANDKKKVKKSKPKYEKYEPAKFAHSGKPNETIKCRLVLTEGDSAMTTAIKGLIKHYGNNYFGFMSTGGVIMNVVRETIVKTIGGRRYCDISPDLAKNVFFSEFLKITGLRLNCEYLPGAPEWRDLNYGGIYACLDQDLDGLGKIFPQVIAMFKTLWPNLLQSGYVSRIPTPIIRCYPIGGGLIDELYTDQEYDKWLVAHNSDAYNIKYYKGLATHTDEEAAHMFEDIENRLLRVEYDDECDRYFEIYLDKDSDERKRVLSMPVTYRDDETCLDELNNHRVSCTSVLRYDADHFQRDDLNRKLIGIDGMNESGRKIVDAAIKVFRGSNKEIRVSELAAKVVEFEMYHHGEASLYENIKGKAFIDVGGKQLPLLLPFGNFGSRRLGGKDAGQARYVHTKLNKKLVDLVYPSIDYGMLKFVASEGKRAEPVWFPGIIPMHLSEHTEMPAHGWKIKVVARDALDLISATRTLIYNGVDAHMLPLRYYIHGWTGHIKLINGSNWSCGRFNVFKVKNTNYIRIVELPLRTWTQSYITGLRARVDSPNEKVIRDVVNDSPDRVDILITLYDGALELLEKKYGDVEEGIEQYFELRTRLYENLNFMGINGEVLCFDSPEQAIRYWYPHRRALYVSRTERKCIMLELKIMQLEQKQRYIESGISILDMEDAQIDVMLHEAGYAKIYKKILDCPDYIPNDKIAENVLGHKKSSYKYLIDGVNDRARTRAGKAALAAEIAKLKAELLTYKENVARDLFPGAREWLQELRELEAVIKIGRETNWTYDRGNKFTFAKTKK
ncbi:DNA topoisomerase 2 [Faustovirus]|nr:DNA topoisomerase 2 [Faustovirus]QJX73716.1 DNA topoisomerase 2 [Faustovirus]SMH63226.1 Phage-associated DNA topoisomerase II large subunit gp60 plus gp39 [Faustovirus]